MKILTYNSFGTSIPTVLADKIKELNTTIRGNSELISFVESFDNGQYPVRTMDDLEAQPTTLFPLFAPRTGADGITRQCFLGYVAATNNIPAGAVRVTVNTYDETTTKVYVEEYDGAEMLSVLPEYVPVEGIPGLYTRKS